MHIETTKESRKSAIHAALKDLQRWLPHQGPIGVFIHRNPLEAFEGERFSNAVETAAKELGARPYMPHRWYLDALNEGRIEGEDCFEAVSCQIQNTGLEVLAGRKKSEILMAALTVPREPVSDETTWHLLDSLLKGDHRDQSAARHELWNIVLNAFADHGLFRRPFAVLEDSRDFRLCRSDERLISLVSSFLDTGVSHWPMPGRQNGFLKCVRQQILTSESHHETLASWFSKAALETLKKHECSIDILEDALAARGVSDTEIAPFLRSIALKMPGWSGMLGYKDHERNSATQGVGLADFLALSLLLRSEGSGGGWQEDSSHADHLKAGDVLWRAHEVLLILLELEVTAAELAKWTNREWTMFVDWLENFGDVDRRRCMQMAFEANYRKSFLRAVGIRQKQKKAIDALPEKALGRKLQAVFCIDEREESIRRYFEELIPGAETFGAAGFFGMDMCFKDAVHGAVTPLCPPVVSPKHLVIEKFSTAKKVGASRAERFIFEHSRSLTGGAWISQLTGIGAALPLVSQVLAPKNKAAGSNGAAATDLEFEYTGRTSEDGLRIGYTVDEMADRVEAILRGIGLVDAFAKVVMLVGHGSKSLNNPHESAHDCGACGGNRGSKNSRVFARMANHPGVRQALKTRGILVPESTWFVGAYHDTCSDEIDLFDVHLAPDAIRSDLQNLEPVLRNVRAHNAAERCRRFSVGNSKSTEHAYDHVLKRAHDLRQPRPEYGHATNAALVVGRRNLTAGLFLDRRAFLLSYDPTRDSGGVILGKLLQAVIPVCAGINLEYFFSFMDNERYGCGTKLPHNIAGLLGVMNGAQSDLRAGLPLQMIEVHEPMRLLVTIETKPVVMDQLMRENRALNRYVTNGWIQLTVVDGDSGEISRWSDSGWLMELQGGAEIPQAVSSREYTIGQSNFLAPVLVNGGV